MSDPAPHRRFRDLDIGERRAHIAETCNLDLAELQHALDTGGIDPETADRMVENALGLLGLPFGVALNFRINGRDHLVPMAIEEPSVIAAASHAAKRIREGGGFIATSTDPIMIAQIEVHDVPDEPAAVERILAEAEALKAAADRAVPTLVERGGGARGLRVRALGEGFVVVHLEIDCREAMGANIVNTVAESLGPRVAELCNGTLGLRILSNFCDLRTTRVTARVPISAMASKDVDGLEAARGVASASRFAELDPYRAVTHNKGAANGMDAVIVATGNDWRATSAAAHAYAARTGQYRPLATWRLNHDETALEGVMEVAIAVGAIGGALRAHRGARLALSILRVESSTELAQVIVAAGLASNLAALRALATEGIQRGHMRLHHRATTEGK
ncbi:MAG: hydroxymethylglutaryl-CoA reductase, degradative [Polyangiaceae bacterium]